MLPDEGRAYRLVREAADLLERLGASEVELWAADAMEECARVRRVARRARARFLRRRQAWMEQGAEARPRAVAVRVE